MSEIFRQQPIVPVVTLESVKELASTIVARADRTQWW